MMTISEGCEVAAVAISIGTALVAVIANWVRRDELTKNLKRCDAEQQAELDEHRREIGHLKQRISHQEYITDTLTDLSLGRGIVAGAKNGGIQLENRRKDGHNG